MERGKRQTISVKSVALTAWILILFYAWHARAIAHAEDTQAQREIAPIYDRLYQSIGISRPKPKLVLRPEAEAKKSLLRVAWFDAVRNTVVLDERVYTLSAAKFGARWREAIAMILGHELAHFYWAHSWASDFGSQYSDLKIGKAALSVARAEEVGFLEAQADYTGGFFSYLAGFDVKPIAAPLFDIIYESYQLTDSNLSNYPTKSDRQKISAGAIERLSDRVLVFNAAIRLLIAGLYEKAGYCFDFIAKDFYGREILNNAGVARSLHALRLFHPLNAPEFAYAYPFEFDAHTRLEGRMVYGFLEGGDFRYDILREAKDFFTKAILADPAYAPAYVNLAAVHQLLNENDFAMAYARKSLVVAEAAKEELSIANAHIMLGIAYANSTLSQDERERQAKQEFDKAASVNPALAAANIAVLQVGPANISPPKATVLEPLKAKEIVRFDAEEIQGLNPGQRRMVILSEQPLAQEMFLPGELPVRILTKTITRNQQEQAEVISVEYAGMRANFVSTRPQYNGRSARGIRIGESVNVVKAAYGEAPSVLSSRQTTYYVYRKAQIIFEVNLNGNVAGWTIYNADPETFDP